MPIKKVTKSHTSSRKKASASPPTKQRTKKATKKASAKTSKASGKSSSKRKLSEAEWRKLRERTLKMFQMVYDDYQQGKFHRIL